MHSAGQLRPKPQRRRALIPHRLTLHWQPLHLYGVFAIVFVIAAGCLLLLKPSTSQAQPALAQA